MGSVRVDAQRLHQTGLGSRQQFREHTEVTAAGSGELERSLHVDADHVVAGREPQLTLASEKHVPSLMLLAADQGVLAIGTEPSVGSRLASGAGQVVVSAGSAVFGPRPAGNASGRGP